MAFGQSESEALARIYFQASESLLTQLEKGKLLGEGNETLENVYTAVGGQKGRMILPIEDRQQHLWDIVNHAYQAGIRLQGVVIVHTMPKVLRNVSSITAKGANKVNTVEVSNSVQVAELIIGGAQRFLMPSVLLDVDLSEMNVISDFELGNRSVMSLAIVQLFVGAVRIAPKLENQIKISLLTSNPNDPVAELIRNAIPSSMYGDTYTKGVGKDVATSVGTILTAENAQIRLRPDEQ